MSQSFAVAQISSPAQEEFRDLDPQTFNDEIHMPSPFGQKDASFLAPMNDEGQHSIWPQSNEIPAAGKTPRPFRQHRMLRIREGKPG